MAEPCRAARVWRDRVSSASGTAVGHRCISSAVGAARVGRHRISGAAPVGRHCISGAIGTVGVGRHRVSGAIGTAGVGRYCISSAIGTAAGATRATASTCAADNRTADASRATISATSAGARAPCATTATRAGPAGAASTAGRRIRGEARAGAITSCTESARRGLWRSIAGACTVAGEAARITACAAFTLWIAARGVVRAFANPPGLVARHAGAIARALATHPIHAEASSADRCAGTSRAVLALAGALAIARLSARAATGHFGARSRGCAGAFVAGHRARLARTRTGRLCTAHAVHAEPRGADRRRGGGTSLAVAEIRDFVLPYVAGQYLNSTTERHHDAALAIECHGRLRIEDTGAGGGSAQIPSRTLAIQLPGFEGPGLRQDGGQNLPSAQAIVDHRISFGVVGEIGDVATGLRRPTSRNRIPLPVHDAVAGVVALVQKHLLPTLVEGQAGVTAPARRDGEQDRCAVGPGRLAAIPFPDDVVLWILGPGGSGGRVERVAGLSVASEEEQLGTPRIGDHARSVARLGAGRRLKLGPLAGAGVPFPGVTQDHSRRDRGGPGVRAAIQDEGLAGRIVGHRRIHPAGGPYVARNLGPGGAVPLPQVVKKGGVQLQLEAKVVVVVVRTSEHVHLARGRAEGHGGVRARNGPCLG